MKTVKTLLTGLEKKYKLCAILSPITMIGEVALEVAIPYIMAKIIDVGIANHDLAYTAKAGLLMVGAALLSLCCGVLSGRFAAVASQGFGANLRGRLFNKVQDFSFGNVDRFSTASLVTRLTTDVTNVQNTFQMIIRMCIRSPIMLISAAWMSFYINKNLASMFFVVLPILAVLLFFIGKSAFPRFQEMLKKYDSLNATVQENINAIRVVKAFVRGEHENEKFRSVANDVRNAQFRAEKIIILNMPLMQLVMYICIIAALWQGGNLIIGGTLQTGQLISFITYISQVLIALMMLSMIFVMLVISKASINRVMEVFKEDADIVEEAYSDLKVLDGSVEFSNVSFSYNKSKSTTVLDNISFSLKSGQTAGIIGGTGSAKSTLVQLIPRLYDTLEGTVKVGGNDVRSYKLQELRSQVAMVLQNNVLFSGTIKENLLWGNPNASTEELTESCISANAHDFITSFPEGYETELGQGGVNLSGGQKQRLCIARALLKKPKILILDDSTSAVDTATDANIRQALKNSLPETTKIIIAQRISSVQDCDVIFVMDDGKIVDKGTHEQLLKTSEVYKEVYESQQKGAN
jgi:ATP-binding cassette subfamily B protein